jgi:hypothetical protein
VAEASSSVEHILSALDIAGPSYRSGFNMSLARDCFEVVRDSDMLSEDNRPWFRLAQLDDFGPNVRVGDALDDERRRVLDDRAPLTFTPLARAWNPVYVVLQRGEICHDLFFA